MEILSEITTVILCAVFYYQLLVQLYYLLQLIK